MKMGFLNRRQIMKGRDAQNQGNQDGQTDDLISAHSMFLLHTPNQFKRFNPRRGQRKAPSRMREGEIRRQKRKNPLSLSSTLTPFVEK
jgi:hypothetical protein